MIEMSIKVKDENSTIIEKEVLYEAVVVSRDDIELQGKVNAVMERFRVNSTMGDAEDLDVIINVKMVW